MYAMVCSYRSCRIGMRCRSLEAKGPALDLRMGIYACKCVLSEVQYYSATSTSKLTVVSGDALSSSFRKVSKYCWALVRI
jgi:hypothetical protein